ncbi:MAG TPA: type III secretion system outer membrane ring subunit SctC [Albitalea sp.]|uniref:type III secretion system outer membrane ring subunit SctC n=1 Tax=Piscinibacter sp. TaxID=1903157 RepID=UPI002ED66EC8
MHTGAFPGDMGRRAKRGAAWSLALLAAVASTAAGAQPIPDAGGPRAAASRQTEAVRWPSRRFVYKAEGKRVSEVLADFAASQGVAAVIGEGVDGVVRASFDAPPNEFLSAISKAYGLIWYFDGAAIYFYPSRAIQSRIFRLKGYNGAQVDDMLRSLELVDRRYPLRYDKIHNTLLVYGPPRHVELVSAAVESLDVGADENQQAVTRVFPLRYAWAADRTFGDKQVPGITSLLRGLYRSAGGTGGDSMSQTAASGDAFTKKAATISRMYGVDRLSPQIPQATAGAGAAGQTDKSLTGTAPRGVRSPLGDAQDSPSFQADEATNSVVVHGRRDRMSEYGDLIKRLDMKPTLIELEAMIIDVSSDSVDSLGISWSASQGVSNLSLTAPQSRPADGSAGGVSSSFTISTLWANAGRELLARVNALESSGKARIVAKPRVLGIANRPALMEEKRVANVRVAGNLDTSLYQVEAGTRLQVTPQVTYYDAVCRIKLAIYIVDGKFEDTQVDQVPVVKHTEILTEAHMSEGESLLIGGISVESEMSGNSGVPGLSRIPLLGGLFRTQSKQTTRSERLFLITPRMLREPAAAASAPASAPVPPVRD